MDIIQSPQNAQVKRIRALLEQSKARRREAAFVAEGARLVEDGLRSGMQPLLLAVSETTSPRTAKLVQSLKDIQALVLTDTLFQNLADTENSQGVLAVFSIPQYSLPENPGFILIPDQVRDPGNLGTILRTAEACGVEAVLLPPGSTDAWAPKVLRAGMGAHFRLPVYSMPWEPIAAYLQGLQILEADMQGKIPCWQANLRQPTAWIIGGEASGISTVAKKLITASVRIPMALGPESLNAAVSAAILLYETMRQRSL